MHKHVFTLLLALITFSACEDFGNVNNADGKLHFVCKIDPNQERLNNIGQPAVIPPGNAAQTPDFRQISVHYIELSPNAVTKLGNGSVVYKAAETTQGGENAVDFDKAVKAGDGETFITIDLSTLQPGTYEWVRASVTYQNYDIKYNIRNLPTVGDLMQQSGTIASFVGFNTWITNVTPRTLKQTVNDDKKQGFWVFESNLSAPYSAYNQLTMGEAPAGATTVVNPLFDTSPVPAGSCVVTGKLREPFVFTGNETGDLTIVLSFSVNNSLEWIDSNGNGQLDFYGDGVTPNEKIVDMGLRGLVPFVD
jgi:hypothetical protein